MDRDRELARLKPWTDKALHFSGWDLSSVQPRLLEQGPAWDYEKIVREYASGKKQVLDIGTGGGEVLSRIRSSLPHTTLATEEWNVNAPVAKRLLAPLDVDVIRCRSMRLPFRSQLFDLVLDRHEELDPAEICRALSEGGHVVTQQVGDHWRELKRYFPRASDFSKIYSDYVRGFKEAGLRILRNEQHYYRIAYKSLGEFVYLLSVAPWEVPGFSLENDLDALLALESRQMTPDGLTLTESRFLIIAQK